MNVPEGTEPDTLGRLLESELRDLGHDITWAIPVQRTEEVPDGAITDGS